MAKKTKSQLSGVGNKAARGMIQRGGAGAGVHGYHKSKAGRSKRACRGKVRDY